jgi:hypothetical protein
MPFDHTGGSSHWTPRDVEEARDSIGKLEVFGNQDLRFPCLLCERSSKRIPVGIRGMLTLALIHDRKDIEWKRRYSRSTNDHGKITLREYLVPRACNTHWDAVIEAVELSRKQGWAECGDFKGTPEEPLQGTVYIFNGYQSASDFMNGPQRDKYDASSTLMSESIYGTASFLSTSTYPGREAGEIVDNFTDAVQKGWEFYK